jgi:predicted sulfurtransferase
MFQGAIAPDVRKFQYWPAYVRNHAEQFNNKRVLMYCTGGIRCETGSVVVKQLTTAKDVMQLEGLYSIDVLQRYSMHTHTHITR